MCNKKSKKTKPDTFPFAPDGFDPALWERLTAQGHVDEMIDLEVEISKEQDRVFSQWNSIALALYEGYVTAIGDVTEFLGGEPGYCPNPAVFLRKRESAAETAPLLVDLWPGA